MYKFLSVFIIFCNVTIAQSLQLSSGNYNLKKLDAQKFKICNQDVFMNQAHLMMQFQQC